MQFPALRISKAMYIKVCLSGLKALGDRAMRLKAMKIKLEHLRRDAEREK